MKYYLVGGFVRDELLGVKSKDVDFAVEGATYEELRDDVLRRGGLIYQERPEFLSIRARDPVFGPADYTLCRTDGFYSDARRPDVVHAGTIYEDLARRDFTVNAIAREATLGKVYLDPHGGRRDLQNMLLRCVGDSRARFREDPLRLLRAVRFHLTRGFRLEASILAAFWDDNVLARLEGTSIERAYEELHQCYTKDSLATMLFFREHRKLEDYVFGTMGLRLAPVIPV